MVGSLGDITTLKPSIIGKIDRLMRHCLPGPSYARAFPVTKHVRKPGLFSGISPRLAIGTTWFMTQAGTERASTWVVRAGL